MLDRKNKIEFCFQVELATGLNQLKDIFTGTSFFLFFILNIIIFFSDPSREVYLM